MSRPMRPMGPKRKRPTIPKRKKPMNWSVPPLRLYMVKGSFFPADEGTAMDAEVWSKLPEELIWEVLRFVPAAAHFRLQSVSRKWRQVLTSAGFRNTVAASRLSEEEEEQQRVVAGLVMAPRSYDDSSSNLKVVEVDLSSFVPKWFWKSDSYRVEAAADGLVCISNDLEYGIEMEPEETRFCVLNPLTRTCKVLPRLRVPFEARGFEPRVWMHPAPAAALTVFGYISHDHREAGRANMATYDLAAARGGGGRVPAACKSIRGIRSSMYSVCPVVALCAGEMFVYDDDSRVHVLAPSGGPCGGRLVEAAAVDEPAVELLGLDAALYPDEDRWRVSMVVHRGTLFYVEALCEMRSVDAEVEVVMGVWRLARERLEWEAVARLDVAELERLTGLECVKREPVHVGCYVWDASAVQEFLYCSVSVDSMRFKVGWNLDTAEWKLLFDEQSPIIYALPVELRPDLFL